MPLPRKIVLILGNGFDLDLGLKTSYKDFWESDYCPKDYPAPLIRHLNQRLQDDLDAVRWYDLENELLNYYHDRKKGYTFQDVLDQATLDYIRAFDSYRYMCDAYLGENPQMKEIVRLGYAHYGSNYLSVEVPYLEDFKQSPSWRDKRALQLIKEKLSSFLNGIEQSRPQMFSVATAVLLAMIECQGDDYVDIFSFNYTRLRIGDNQIPSLPVQYIHGSCETGEIIVGTRDDEDMDIEYDFLQKAMDPAFRPPDIVSSLEAADEVIIFGHSLGENDRQYFEAFFKRQSTSEAVKRPTLVIITKDDTSVKEIKRSLQRITGNKLSYLLSNDKVVFIRTSGVAADKQQLVDFMIEHRLDNGTAQAIISQIMNRE